MPFAPGQSGNPAGRPKGAENRIAREVREFAQQFVESPIYWAKAKSRIANGKAPHLETLLWHYAYGKPKEHVEHSGTVGFRRADVPDHELDERIEQQRRTLEGSVH